MVTVTVRIENHDQCNGTGRIPNDNRGQQRECTMCLGIGRIRKDGGAFKSAATAQTNRGRECYICQGKGYQIVADDRPCYSGCTDGKIVVEAHVGDVLPTEIDRTGTIPKPVAAMIAAELDIVVGAQNRGSTWNEAHLGLGSLWSTTDYGRTWDTLSAAAHATTEANRAHEDADDGTLREAIDAFRQDIREKIATESTQWINLIDRETRVIVDRVAVMVHRGGYTVVSQPSVDSGNHAMLPPTYTPELLNREVQ